MSQCKACQLPPEVLEAVNKELLKPKGTGKPLLTIERELGKAVSKSGLSRHLLNCLWKQKLNRYRDKRGPSGQHYARIVLKDSTTDPPRWSCRSYSDEYAEMEPVGRGFRLRRDDLFIELAPEALRADVAQRAQRAAATTAALLATSRNRPAEAAPPGWREPADEADADPADAE